MEGYLVEQFEQLSNEGRSIYWPYGLEVRMDRVAAGIALKRYSEILPVDTEVDLCVNGMGETEVHYLRLPLTSSKD